MPATWVSFKQIKADVGIEQVLERYGVHLRRITGAALRGRARCQPIRHGAAVTAFRSASHATSGPADRSPACRCVAERLAATSSIS
jgi:hypothetical protein